MANYKPRPPIEDRLWGRVDKSDQDACWLFPNNNNGYGRIAFRGKSMDAHRVAWIVRFGEIPNGLFVLHKCDVKGCVNPMHLELGTAKKNVHDAFARLPKMGRAKLTARQVEEIRSTSMGTTDLAKIYGVHKTTIIRARKHKNVLDGLGYGAEAVLRDARQHFSDSVAAWDAA